MGGRFGIGPGVQFVWTRFLEEADDLARAIIWSRGISVAAMVVGLVFAYFMLFAPESIASGGMMAGSILASGGVVGFALTLWPDLARGRR